MENEIFLTADHFQNSPNQFVEVYIDNVWRNYMSIFLGASGLLNQIDHSSNAKTSLCLDFRSIESSAILSCFSGLKTRLEEGMVDAGVEHVTGFPPNLGATEGGDVNSLTS